MRILLVGLTILVVLAWASAAPASAAASLPWLVRQEALYLSGLVAIALMSLAVLLAARPAWLERPLGGLDRMYRCHKWAGILAVAFAALHWLIEMSGDILKATVGRAGRVPEETADGLLAAMRDLAEDMGEWAIYAVLAMLALTLWRRFPYRPWRLLHQAMPVIYLMLAFHAVLLAPLAYWSQPVGWLTGLMVAAGLYGSVRSLAGHIGRSRQVAGRVVAVTHSGADSIAVECQLEPGWRGHRAGQFAFVSFEDGEGAHPFTIASADRGDRRLHFQIKALGDYTRTLPARLRPGQAVRVEGPYGRFLSDRHDRRARQIWIAGGIGVTPFLAWLEAFQASPGQAPAADLHYCTRDRATDPFVARLEALCAPLPDIHLSVHGTRQGERLDAAALAAGQDTTRPAEVWFCGPRGLADNLREGLKRAWRGRLRFHQEAFEMR
ncbi:MAG: ferric reductase-like transmembrane domain-containing protein [Gallionellaceae bacterium]|nr:ferric reductase-like transmembrane domain-containing protein [Gallionellaceae bacterium]